MYGFLAANAATYPVSGTVVTSSDNLNMRSTPSTSSLVIASIPSGTTVTVTGEATGTAVGGVTKWYSIIYSGKSGYVHSNYIYITPETPADGDFEKQLTAQGFPESYKVLLRKLHAKYPNWEFTALHTNLSWNNVVTAEFGGSSLIDKSASNSWKTYDKGFYNFSTGSFVTFDGGAYHAASVEYLKYCLDPRNFLDDTSVFMFLAARGQTGETEQGVKNILSGLKWAATYPDNDEKVYIFTDGSYKITSSKDDPETTEGGSSESSDLTSSEGSVSGGTSSKASSSSSSSGTSSGSEQDKEIKPGDIIDGKTVKEIVNVNSYASAFSAAQRLTGISSYMLASRLRQEQGVNGNPSGRGEVAGYEGYYNLWNIKTYGDNKYVQGAQHAKSQGWDTPLKSLIGGSKFLDDNYFKTGQDTLYLQKFDVIDGGNGYYWHEYMTYLPAPVSEASILKRGFTSETIKNAAVFKIPVYTGMPDSACVKPTASGTNNNYLKSITVENYELSSAFDVYKFSYDTVVTDASVSVTAVPYDSGAKVTGGGNISLNYGNNTVTLTVTASNGSKRNYTVSIFRKEMVPDPDDPKIPIITSDTYTVGEYVTRVEPGTTAEVFKEKFTVADGTAKLFGADNTEKSASSLVCTGDTVVIYDTTGTEAMRYAVVIYGDVNRDGYVNSIDLLVAQRAILLISEIDKVQTVAANANKDASLNSIDLLYIQMFILGKRETIQGD